MLDERVATRVRRSDRKLYEAAAVENELDLSTWARRALREQAIRDLRDRAEGGGHGGDDE